MTSGLAVFVAVTVVNLGGLLLDLVLTANHLTTVTALVRGGHWWLGVGIIGLQVVGIEGLSYHFWER